MIGGIGLYSRSSGEFDGIDLVTPSASTEHDLAATLVSLTERCQADSDAFVWLGLVDPTRAELMSAAETFHLPPLQVEDAANPRQRPKFDVEDDGRGLVILKVLDYVDSTSDVNTGQIAVFIGPWYVVTVRWGQIGDLRGIRERLNASPQLRAFGTVGVLYAVMDLVVDGYLAITDEVALDVENLETQVFAVERIDGAPTSIYALKRENAEMRRAISPLVNWAHDAVTERIEWVPSSLRVYYRDIGEHLLRAWDSVETVDNLLMTLLMASTSLQDLQQNRDMRKISAWVAIAAVPTALAAIYGMNFDNMPELHHPWGYPAVLTVIAIAAGLLFRVFKRSGWL